jgi:CubicO group peptidase (beta-lactamase class C family)
MTRRWGRDPFRTGLVQAVEDAARQALASSTTPGLAVALVHHGRLIWAAGYGAATAHPHDAHGRQIGGFAFAEQAAAGLVTTAPDLARFLAAALAGPRGEPPGRGVLSPARVQVTLTAAPATDGRWALAMGLA